MASIDWAGNRSSGFGVAIRQLWQRFQAPGRIVVAAICYRVLANGKVEFLLVRTRAGRWTFPKGGMDGDRDAAAAAAREAYEEAGVLGRIEPQPFTGYLHCKDGNTVYQVSAHLCEVVHLEEPPESYRHPTWFSVEKAKQRLRERRVEVYARELERVVSRAVGRLSGS